MKVFNLLDLHLILVLEFLKETQGISKCTSSTTFPWRSETTPYYTTWLAGRQLEAFLFFLFFVPGRKIRATIPTADGLESLTIPTAPGGPHNEVTMAAMVLELDASWSEYTALGPNRSSFVSTSVFSAITVTNYQNICVCKYVCI